MASKKKELGSWQGHPLLDKDHEHELHINAAINEFHGGMDRSSAEGKALEDYRREHHARGAAHHFGGLKAATAVGDSETAQKHHALYSLHLRALGHDPMGPVPEVVRKYHGTAGQDEKQKRVYNFRGHDADQFLVQPVRKSEGNVVDALLAASNKVSDTIIIPAGVDEYLRELAGEEKLKEPVKAEPVEVKKSDPVLQAAAQLKKTLDLIELTKKAIEALRVQGR